MAQQENTIAALLEQAFRIKEEIISHLSSTKSSVQAQAVSHKLLENHINIITHIVKKLSKNIEVLEGQVLHRDHLSSATSFTLQSLDHKNLAGIGDLRGRVARCDASIAKLSWDVNCEGKEILRLQREVSVLRSSMEIRLNELEVKLSQVTSRLDAAVLEQNNKLKVTWEDLQQVTHLQEIKSSQSIKDLSAKVDRMRQWCEQQLHISKDAQVQASAQLRSLKQEKMKEIGEQVKLLSIQVEQGAKHWQKEESRDNQLKHCEDKLSNRINALERTFNEELQCIKNEYRSGFLSIHASINSLNQIGDIKALLEKDKIQKDIKQIQSKIIQMSI